MLGLAGLLAAWLARRQAGTGALLWNGQCWVQLPAAWEAGDAGAAPGVPASGGEPVLRLELVLEGEDWQLLRWRCATFPWRRWGLVTRGDLPGRWHAWRLAMARERRSADAPRRLGEAS
ncbi:hypothetical protein [Ideonella livida]|uniref:Uncharacterized protein n=1 Tax=Ideonella livida TaxID=2707176 RepID=A0A7C9PHU8_9BURK|nr:hypothetical protein [Ideonella livida]NDY91611.1 hypothetical protein [Ideonella livida]